MHTNGLDDVATATNAESYSFIIYVLITLSTHIDSEFGKSICTLSGCYCIRLCVILDDLFDDGAGDSDGGFESQ